MRKIIIIFLLMCVPALATIPITDIKFSNAATTDQIVKLLRSKFTQHNTDLTASAGLSNLGTGEIFYVDSAVGSDSYTGTRPAIAMATLNGGIGLCTAGRGDIIFALQEHNESLTLANGVDADIAGITIVGLGKGNDRPTLDYDAPAGEFVFGADNIDVYNIIFRSSTDTVTTGVDVEDGINYSRIIGCSFISEATTDEFASMVTATGTTGLEIISCFMDAGEAAAVNAIELIGTDGTRITNCEIIGDYSTANINGLLELSTDLVTRENLLWNGVTSALNAQPSIELLTGTVGFNIRNDVICNVANVDDAFVGDGMFNILNTYTETAGATSTAWLIGVATNTGGSVTVTAQ